MTTRLELYFFGKPTPAFEDDAVLVAVTLLLAPKHPCSVSEVRVLLKLTVNIRGVLEN